MDTFSPVRRAARRLHDGVLATGADVQSSISLVEAAVRTLDLALVWLEPQDAALKGSHALFDEQSGTICCADVGDAATRAERVAHEIGHACIHKGSAECAAGDIEVSRSTEIVPVGLQRVEDYGRRERRELQANVFAREFLLPWAKARDLHLRDRLGASEIAARLSLTVDLVRQQLLDALLLPSTQAADSAHPSPLITPDPSQDRAAAHHGSPFLLQAGPGTGKTRTLVTRVLALLADRVDPATILVLTFSNRAAGELAERLATDAAASAPQIWIGTFHAFGLDLIRRHHDRLGLPADPLLFDRSDAIEVLEEILPTLPLVHFRNLWDPAMVLRDIVAAISRAKDEMTDPRRYRSLAEDMLARTTGADDREAAEKALEVAHVYGLYEAALRARAAVDFGDLVMRPALLLEDDESLRAAIQLRHRHVLVDEYQDVNHASSRLLAAISGDGRRLWVVGDARQSIYRFRGASSTNMTAFANGHPQAVVGQLSVNYRSTRTVVNALVGMAPRMGASEGMLPLAFTPARDSVGSKVQIRRFATIEDEASGIAASIRELEADGVRLRDQAVLCRTNSRLSELAAVLEGAGIPVLHLGSLFEREEVRDLLALLSLAVDRFGDGLVRVAAMDRYRVPLQDVQIVTAFLHGSDVSAFAALRSALSAEGLSADGARGLACLADDLAGLPPGSWPWDFLASYLLDRTDTMATLACRDTVADRMRGIAIWQFMNFARERTIKGPGSPIFRMLNRVRQLVLLAEERDLRQIPPAALHIDAVRLMTVHGSKGLEFEAVHVPSLMVASFPSSYRGQRCPAPQGMIAGAENLSTAEEARQAQAHEEECLFFVAVSRARTHLRLYLAEKHVSGRSRSPSPFLNWIPAAVVQELVHPPLTPTSARVGRAPIEVTWTGGRTLTDEHLRSYEKCPRRFFYTHVLGLRGGRKQTAFTRTHDCLHRLISWLVSTRRERTVSEDDAKVVFESLWQTHGPVDHAFAGDYRRLADRLVTSLVRLSTSQRFCAPESLAIDLAGGRIVVTPDEIAQLPDGTIVLRRLHTGRKRTDEYDRLEYALYHMAGQKRYGSSYVVEAVHIADELAEPVQISATKLSNRRSKGSEMVTALAAGRFPPEVDPVSCPRCPHFFICPATPRGPLTRP